jgi:hypothetical protein
MNKDEIAKKFTEIDQLMDQVIFAFMQTKMSYSRQRKKSSGCYRKRDFRRKRK